MNPKELDRYNEKKVFSARNYFLLSGILINLSGKVSIRHYRYKGYGLVWTSIFLMLLILLIGLSIDTAKISLVYHQMQNAADAAALAGANFVRNDQDYSRQQAQDIANANIKTQNDLDSGSDYELDLNTANDPAGDIVIGWYNRTDSTFTPWATAGDAVNAMAVISTRSTAKSYLGGPIGMIFGAIASVPSVDMGGTWQSQHRPYAIAMCAGGTGAGLIALDTNEGENAIYMHGTVTIDVTAVYPANPNEGEIQCNSDFWVDGGPTIEASAINITGSMEVGNYDLTIPYNDAPALPDPLEWLEEPTWDVADDLSFTDEILAMDEDDETKNGILIKDYNHPIDPVTNLPDPNINITWELYPGYYSEGFIINCGSTAENPVVNFNPGVYIIGGSEGLASDRPSGLVLDAQTYITSDEATFFITHNADGTDWGVVDIDAQAGLEATEPTSGYYEGITIFQDRDNTNPATINGGGGLDLEGTLYFPNNLVYLVGGGGGFGNQLIAWQFDIGGNSDIGINYDGRNRAPVTTAFLVE